MWLPVKPDTFGLRGEMRDDAEVGQNVPRRVRGERLLIRDVYSMFCVAKVITLHPVVSLCCWKLRYLFLFTILLNAFSVAQKVERYRKILFFLFNLCKKSHGSNFT